MQQSLDELRERAEQSANGFRGHRIRWTKAIPGNYRYTQQGNCTKCPAWVDLNTNPPANGIDIGGPAVALDCPAIPKEG